MNFRKQLLSAFALCMLFGIKLGHTHGNQSEHDSTEAKIQYELYKGQAVTLDLDAICASKSEDCVDAIFEIVTGPSEGILFRKRNTSRYTYQHAGTSSTDDVIEVSYTSHTGQGEFAINLAVAVVRPSILIVHPQPDQTLDTKNVTVLFEVIGKGVDHVHVSLGDSTHTSISPEPGQYSFTNLRSGEHGLTLSLASADHRQIPGSAQTIKFTITDKE